MLIWASVDFMLQFRSLVKQSEGWKDLEKEFPELPVIYGLTLPWFARP